MSKQTDLLNLTDAITVDSSNNVGIGTSSPQRPLSIGTHGSSSSAEIAFGTTTTGNASLLFGDGTAGTALYDGYIQYQHNGGNMLFATGGGSERMRIDSSGKLSLTASDQGIQIGPDIAAYTIKRDSGGLLNFRATQTNFNGYIFDTVDGERMRIDSSGNLLVGTTNPIAANAKINIQIADQGMAIKALNNGNWAAGYYNSSGSNVGQIIINASSTSYNTSSDYRLKTDAQPMTGASARVQALNPVNFEWIADGTRVDGFLAHEAQEVVPEAVNGTKDAMRDEQYEVTPAVYEDVVIPAVLDEEGNELEAERTEQRLVSEAVVGTRSVPDYQGIDQSKLVPLLTAALQEALTEIAGLKARVTALEAV